MDKNYLVYPLAVMTITQSYQGTTSHLPHTTGEPKDYPIDDGGKDSGRDYMVCPCDKMMVRRIYGVGNNGTNTIWLQSTDKVYFADGTKDYCTMMVIHPNDDDLKKLKVGQTFKRGEKICREGSDGGFGNHFHFSLGKGQIKGIGWQQNSKGKWVLSVQNKTEKPENMFYIDSSFTKIMQTKGLNFKLLPEEKESTKEKSTKEKSTDKENTSTKEKSEKAAKYTMGEYEVTTSVLNVRTGAGTKYSIVPFSKMTKSAQEQIKEKWGIAKNGYVKGVVFTALEIKGNWGRTPSGWVCLDYCKKLK